MTGTTTAFQVISTVTVVAALGLSAFQTRRLVLDARKRDEDRRIERALEFYRDLLVTGETSSSFERLSVHLRRLGGEAYGCSTWILPEDGFFDTGGVLDPALPENDVQYQDLYRVLWFFERVDNALKFQLVDSNVLFVTVGFHCWWWGNLLRDIRRPKASSSLHSLAPAVERWAQGNGDLDDWRARCQTDFNGGPSVSLQ